jgi:hypothetical protein
MNIDTRFFLSLKNSSSNTGSTEITVPSAGDRILFWSVVKLGCGFLKNKQMKSTIIREAKGMIIFNTTESDGIKMKIHAFNMTRIIRVPPSSFMPSLWIISVFNNSYE